MVAKTFIGCPPIRSASLIDQMHEPPKGSQVGSTRLKRDLKRTDERERAPRLEVDRHWRNGAGLVRRLAPVADWRVDGGFSGLGEESGRSGRRVVWHRLCDCRAVRWPWLGPDDW